MIGPVRRWLRTAGPGDRASSALRPVPTFSTLTADGWSGRPATGWVPARDRTEGPGCACGSTTGCPDPNSVNAGRGSRSLDVERCEGVGVESARRPFSLAALGAQCLHARAVIADTWAPALRAVGGKGLIPSQPSPTTGDGDASDRPTPARKNPGRMALHAATGVPD